MAAHNGLRWVPRLLLLLSFAHAGMANAAVDPAVVRQWKRTETAHMAPVKGNYRNDEYGFSVPALLGVTAYHAVAPNTNHGTVYFLGYQRTIHVSAAFDVLSYRSAAALLTQRLKGVPPTAIARETAILAGKPAEKATWRHGGTLNQIFAQYRPERSGILYELVLTTTPADQARDMALFTAIVEGFRTLPTSK